jgi:hypothetical protein
MIVLRAALALGAAATWLLAGCGTSDQSIASRRALERDLPFLVGRPGPLEGEHYFAFAFFRDSPDSGMFLALSTDGLHFAQAGTSPVLPPIGIARGMRDPSICQGPDGVYHLVFTGGGPGQIGYASSRDLVTWSPPRSVDLMTAERADCWAPEVTFDPASAQFVIAWSAEVAGRDPHTAWMARANHRLYCTTTTDFRAFAPPHPLLDPGYPVIDAAFLHARDHWYLFFKDEREHPFKKQIRVVSGPAPWGPWTPPSAALTARQSEGPAILDRGPDVVCFYDEYAERGYGAIRSVDLSTWEDITPYTRIPWGARHGCVVVLTVDLGRSLLARAGGAAPR